jgi:hypothetical protein
MLPRRFRPTLDALEDRHTPAVSPGQAWIAMQNADAIMGTLRFFGDHLGEAKTAQQIQSIATYTTKLTVAARSDVQVLSDYRTELQGQISANPQLAGNLAPMLSQIASAQVNAAMGAVLARATTIGFGTPVTVVDPPPPAPPPPPGPITGLNPTDASGLTGTFPNPNDPNFKDLGDGVKIIDVALGSGTAAASGDKVSVFYTGWLAADGTQFDSNRTSGTPLRSPLQSGSLIDGFVEGVIGMKPGGIRDVFIPAVKGYGAAGSPPKIPPNADLVFEIKLLTPGT